MAKDIKIQTFSDAHGRLKTLRVVGKPDLIVNCGDLAPHNIDNFTFLKDGKVIDMNTKANKKASRHGFQLWDFRDIDRKAEGEYQAEWIESVYIPYLRSKGVSLEDVVFVCGNHDFFDPTPYFPNSIKTGSKTISLKGIKIGLLVGVMPYFGEWHDEVDDDELGARILRIDRDIDLLVSHCPVYGVRDKNTDGDKIGSGELYKAIFNHNPHFQKLRLHVFGHVHGRNGIKKFEVDGRNLTLANSAESRFDFTL